MTITTLEQAKQIAKTRADRDKKKRKVFQYSSVQGQRFAVVNTTPSAMSRAVQATKVGESVRVVGTQFPAMDAYDAGVWISAQ